MYFAFVGQMKKMLGQLDAWLEGATEFAKKKSFDPNVFLELRLAPDQFAFGKQVTVACETAKTVSSRLSGKEAPAGAEADHSIEGLRARIRGAIAFLEGFTEKDFEHAATKSITQPRWEGKVMTGADYFVEHGMPNFFFHITHAYAILRHNGVSVGKRDYLGKLTQRMP